MYHGDIQNGFSTAVLQIAQGTFVLLVGAAACFVDRRWAASFLAGSCFHSCLVDGDVLFINFFHCTTMCQGVGPVRRGKSRWY